MLQCLLYEIILVQSEVLLDHDQVHRFYAKQDEFLKPLEDRLRFEQMHQQKNQPKTCNLTDKHSSNRFHNCSLVLFIGEEKAHRRMNCQYIKQLRMERETVFFIDIVFFFDIDRCLLP